MSDWLQTLNVLASSIEGRLDAARYHRRLRNHWIGPIEIQAYRGHGTAHTLYLKGRVLEHRDTVGADESDGIWDNIVQMYRRFASREIPDARLIINHQELGHLLFLPCRRWFNPVSLDPRDLLEEARR